MINVSDRDFGELKFDGAWTGECEILIFGSLCKVDLVVQIFDGATISEVQRLAFREFELDKNKFSVIVGEAVFNYYLSRIDEYRACFGTDELAVKVPDVYEVDDMRSLVSLRCVKIMSPFEADVRQVGFIFDAIFDPQLGLGVLVTNGSVEAVDTQDILLG
ncbi:DUF6985 domain-containing protein [Pseudomonas asplenii]|uniref:DUF6985 domain-containing protein n=1 Tax=Pseudomonas asplenii TaxID=53407 RepID=UPI0023615CBA|nr:hypothetical protein [Pseudomonas asplenii]